MDKFETYKHCGLTVRKGTQDESIVDEVLTRNCYRLPNDLSGVTVIDIGANIGAFAVACQRRNARRVHCYEPDRNNYNLMYSNVNLKYGDLHSQAVVGEEQGEVAVLSNEEMNDDGVLMTGSRRVMWLHNMALTGFTHKAETTTIKELLKGHSHVDRVWLKLDCEGSEWGIIDSLTSDLIANVECILGEIHLDDAHDAHNIDDINNKLLSLGYSTALKSNPDDGSLITFFSTRQAVRRLLSNVCILTPFRNARGYLQQYFAQLSILRSLLPDCYIRLVAAEGDSEDGTRERIIELANDYNFNLSIIDTTHGRVPWKSVEDPARLRTMSDVMNAALSEVSFTDDCAVWLMSDVKYDAHDLSTAIEDTSSNSKYIIAPMVYIEGTEYFWDTWAYRANGERFINEPPYHRALSEAIGYHCAVDSAGTLLVMGSAVARTCKASELEAVSFCEDANDKGFQVIVNSNWPVYHPNNVQSVNSSAGKLLVIGDALVQTGNSRITHQLLPVLSERGIEFDVLGLSYHGTPHNLPYRVWPMTTPSIPTAAQMAAEIQHVERYDRWLLITDWWELEGFLQYINALEDGRKPKSVIVIAGIDNKNQRPLSDELHKYISHLVVWTEFARNEVLATGYEGPISVISLGVDSVLFTPMDKLRCRQQLIVIDEASDEASNDGSGIDLSSCFMVGTFAFNQHRKRLDILLSAFSKWIRENEIDDSYLVLRTNLSTKRGYDIVSLVRYFNLQNRVLILDSGSYKLPDSVLPVFYNCLDVYISTSIGEGFGLPALEAMSCGVPCILPDFAAYGEYGWVPPGRCAAKVAVNECCMSPSNVAAYAIGGEVSIPGLINELQLMYDDKRERERLSLVGRDLAQSLTWKKFTDGIVELVVTDR